MSDLFYSYGYDPLIDKVLKFDLVDIIEKNPNSVTPGLAFTITTYDLFDGEYSPVDSKQLIIDEFNVPGALQDLDITFDTSVSNYSPAEATVIFKAVHATETSEGHVKLALTEDFEYVLSDVKVEAVFGFTTTSPTFSLIDSKTIEIHDLKALEPGDQVKFTVSSIRMPRYQGNVKEPLRVSIIESTTQNVIDESEFEYFVQEAAVWDFVDLSLSSH